MPPGRVPQFQPGQFTPYQGDPAQKLPERPPKPERKTVESDTGKKDQKKTLDVGDNDSSSH